MNHETFKNLNLSHKGESLYIEGIKYTPSQFAKNLNEIVKQYQEMIPDVGKLRIELIDNPLSEFDKRKLFTDLLESSPARSDGKSIELDETSALIREKHYPARNVETGEYILIDKEVGHISPVAFDNYKDTYTASIWKNEVSPTLPAVVVGYSPSRLPDKLPVYLESGKTYMPAVNSYIRPPWQFEDDLRAPLDERHRKVIEPRFDNQESLERYYCALYHMINSRNCVATGVIHPTHGTGKTTVMAKLPSALVGVNNAYAPVSKEFFTGSPFKDPLYRCRALCMDEFVLYPSYQNQFKKLLDPVMSINRKNKTEIPVSNTWSMFFTSNNTRDVNVTPGDRRVSILDDSGFHILHEHGPDFVREYLEALNNPEFMANLGYWVLNNFKDFRYSAIDYYHGHTYERAVIDSCPFEVVRDLATALVEKSDLKEVAQDSEDDSFTYYAAKNQHKKNLKKLHGGTPLRGQQFMQASDFEAFFTKFRWKGEPLCSVTKDELETSLNVTVTRL
jgi:hypothetical protein